MPRCHYTVLVEWDDDRRCFVGYVPALNWLADQGATEEELRERILEAIEGYIESLRKEGLPIPSQDPPGALAHPWRPQPSRATRELRCGPGVVSLSFAPR